MLADSKGALAQAQGLADLVGAEAARSEADATLSPVVVEAFHETGLFGLMVPKELGGEEADLPTVLSVYEEVSRADGSAGWTLLANATTSAFAGAYTGPAAVAEMFAGERIPVAAGQFSPRGTAVRAGDRAGDGYVVSGRYSFGSGSAHSPWIGGGALELRDGEFVLGASGLPRIRAYFVPRERVEFLDNWDVMGLAGTGSYDYEVPEQTIADDFTFDLIVAEPRRGGPVYRLGVLGLTAAGHAAFALGVGRRGMEELTRIVQTKHRLGADPLRDQQLFRHDYAMHDAALHAARAFVYESFATVQDVLESGDDPTTVQRQRLRQAATYATRVATDAVRFAYTAAGTDALRPSVLQRCFRDLHAATQHLVVDNNTLTETTRVLLGLEH
ncbi:MAG TPA: acyl-CoA dehydrogenase family protein [Acidimicrobiia bacterium]|jgi:alkylation response protein AidB-like acyl-CoA dehydrogenase|nr:acyl-CoA dehydrogenase family protein [Acidimicrobiia bacterium]